MSWNDAMKLSKIFAGYNDWRLPTKEELMTMADVTSPTIITTYFPTTLREKYWSSSHSATGDGAWYVYFGSGYTSYYYKNENYFVRLVR